MDNKLGQRIKSLREDHKLTQRELAKQLNVANTTLSQYESGQRVPSDEVKLKIAEYFGVSVDYLLGATRFIHATEYIDELKERLKKKGYDISDMSYEEIADLLEKGLKLDEMFKSK